MPDIGRGDWPGASLRSRTSPDALALAVEFAKRPTRRCGQVASGARSAGHDQVAYEQGNAHDGKILRRTSQRGRVAERAI